MKKPFFVILIFLVVATGLILFATIAKSDGIVNDPSADLATNLVYWQEQAVALAAENKILKTDNERLKQENKWLNEDLADADMLILDLRANINDLAIKVEQMNSLRIQAENALSLANITIKNLEETIKKLSGVRFGLLIGATYDGGFGGMAGITINF